MRKKQIDFTVIIPTHNRAPLLERALKSVKAQVKDRSIEVVVISDTQDEETSIVCNKYLDNNDIFIRRSGALGPSDSRNIGLKLAHGRHIIFLDDDDELHLEFMKSFKTAQSNSDEDFFYTNCTIIKERRANNKTEFLTEQLIDLNNVLSSEIYVKNQIPFSCYIFPSYLLKGIEFDTSMRAYEDWDFLLSVLDKKFPQYLPIFSSKIYQVDEDTSDRRGSSTVAKDFNAVLDYLYVYRRHQSPNIEIQEKRSSLLSKFGLVFPRTLI